MDPRTIHPAHDPDRNSMLSHCLIRLGAHKSHDDAADRILRRFRVDYGKKIPAPGKYSSIAIEVYKRKAEIISDSGRFSR
jgi:hypothetical protein